MKHSVALLQIDPPEEASAWPKAQKASGWKGWGAGGGGECKLSARVGVKWSQGTGKNRVH